MWRKRLLNKIHSHPEKIENEDKVERQQQLDDAVRLLELDTGHDEATTQELMDNINTLKQIHYEDQETARRYLANRNLEAETPTKNFCNQVKNSRKKAKLTCLLQERKLTANEFQNDPTQKQYEEIFSKAKIKDHVKNFYTALYAKNPPNLTKLKLLTL